MLDVSLKFQDFVNLIRKISPWWSEYSDLMKIHRTVSIANSEKGFYISEFLILLILMLKGPLKHKLELIFELLSKLKPNIFNVESKTKFFLFLD